jgi:hypothetical protein
MDEMLNYVPHRQWVFSIPKRLRIYFMMDRRLLPKLSQCAWKVLSRYLKQTVAFEDAVPGAVIAVQSLGDFLGFNSHLHVIGTNPTEADRICLNAQFHVKKTMLTVKPASATRKVIVCVNGCFNMLC